MSEVRGEDTLGPGVPDKCASEQRHDGRIVIFDCIRGLLADVRTVYRD